MIFSCNVVKTNSEPELNSYESNFKGINMFTKNDHFVYLMYANYLKTAELDKNMPYFLRQLRDRCDDFHFFGKRYDELREQTLASKNEADRWVVSLTDFLDKTAMTELIKIFIDEVNGQGDDFNIFKSIRFISEMMDFSPLEEKLFQLFYILTTDGNWYTYTLMNDIQFSSDRDTFLAKAFNVSRNEIASIMDIGSSFFMTGLFEPNNKIKEMFSVIHKVTGLLGNETILSNEIIEAKLFPNILSTELTVGDYHQVEDIKVATDVIENSIINKQIGINILLWGIPGMGKTELAIALAKQNNWKLKVIGDVGQMSAKEQSRHERLFTLNVAQKLFARSSEKIVLLFDEMEDLIKFDGNAMQSKAFINRIIEKTSVPIIWTTNDMYSIGPAILRRMTFNIPFNKPPPEEKRKEIWSKYANLHNIVIGTETLDHLSREFDVVPAIISNVMKVIKLSNLDETHIMRITTNLDTAMNLGEERSFNIKRKTENKFDPEFSNTNINLDNLTNNIITRGKKNFSILSYGPSGTGKSAYAIFLAEKMNMRYKIVKASDLLDAFLGETEKKIANMFSEAAENNKFIILDEADSFFQNRSGAHRSWEVTQVNEMLTQMETHELPFVCTTNLEKSIDPAAFRRFTFKIKYDYSTQEQIVSLYKNYFNRECPVEVNKMRFLTPGDFANIANKMNFLGDLDDATIVKMMKEECEIKPTYKHKIGF